MRVLIIGSGAREHALAECLKRSPLLTDLYVAPGNAGTAAVARNVPIGASDVAALVRFAVEVGIDLVVPGPEAPLVAGLADALRPHAIHCFGPSAAAARLEGSKSFTKSIADAAGVPNAAWEYFTDAEAARAFVRHKGAPIVVKADGLAAGKGVVVAQSVAEAEQAITAMMEQASLGEAGASVVIEECLVGAELSLFALCDGLTAIPLGLAQDHKRVGENDTGANTGGMGAIAPPPFATPEMVVAGMERIIFPTLTEMHRRGTPFRGVLFAGLMLTSEGLKLIEYNVRLGDPEAQALLPCLASDLLPALVAGCDGTLADAKIAFADVASAAVVMAARGYPGASARMTPVGGVEEAAREPGVRVFHAATDRRDGVLYGLGGRVLTIAATAPTLAEAITRAYAGVARIDWPEGFCRPDIGRAALGAEI